MFSHQDAWNLTEKKRFKISHATQLCKSKYEELHVDRILFPIAIQRPSLSAFPIYEMHSAVYLHKTIFAGQRDILTSSTFAFLNIGLLYFGT